MNANLDHTSTEERFWEWFVDHEHRLFHFEVFRDELMPALNEQIKLVHPALCFGIGPVWEGRREFTISANGNLPAFPAVTALHGAHPELPRWDVVKFRQRFGPIPHLNFEGIRVESRELRFALHRDGDKLGIVVFMLGHDDPQRQHAVFIMLDHTLGEYDMETRVGAVGWLPLDEVEQYPTCTLEQLPDIFDRVIAEGGDDASADPSVTHR